MSARRAFQVLGKELRQQGVVPRVLQDLRKPRGRRITNHFELGARTAEDAIVERDLASLRRGVAHLPRRRHVDGVVAPVVVKALDAVAIPRPLAKIEAVTLAELESVAHFRWTESRITAHRDPGHDIRHFLRSNNGGPERGARPEGDFLSEFQGVLLAFARGESHLVARSWAIDDDPRQLAVIQILREHQLEALAEAF